jgi:3'-5' exonuclease
MQVLTKPSVLVRLRAQGQVGRTGPDHGLLVKPDGIDGSQVEAYFNAGRIQEIADYCKSDVINTYRLWLWHELFRGRLDKTQFEYSERDVERFVSSK